MDIMCVFHCVEEGSMFCHKDSARDSVPMSLTPADVYICLVMLVMVHTKEDT